MIPGFGEVAEKLRRSTVQVLAGREGSGSGVIWSADGLIVTNAHVARGERAQIELWDGRRLAAAVLSRDDRRDLARLQVNAADLPAAPIGNAQALRPGEWVMAVGNPLGFQGALTTGVVHALGPLRGLGRREWVQANVRLAPGNSGGPLADAQGRVVGINTMILNARGSGGLAFAVPSNTVEQFLQQGASGFRLGVTIRPVQGGLLVLEVAPGSLAERASLLVGDLLVGLRGQPFRSADDLSDVLSDPPGDLLRLQFRRGGQAAVREVALPVPRVRAGVAA